MGPRYKKAIETMKSNRKKFKGCITLKLAIYRQKLVYDMLENSNIRDNCNFIFDISIFVFTSFL